MSASESDSISQMEVYMGEEKRDRDAEFSFMKEKIKEQPLYRNPWLRRIATAVICGFLFALAAVAVWAFVLPWVRFRTEKQEVKQFELPAEETTVEVDVTETEEESPIYITETVSMEVEDYRKLYQQLMQLGNQVEKSLVNIAAVSTDTDWFDETYTTQNSVCGTVVGDNGVELLILTEYAEISNGDQLLVTFFDHTTASGTLKKYDRNTGLAVVSVNLGDIEDGTRELVQGVEVGSSRSVRSGEPVIAVGSPMGTFGSVLFGNLTSVSQSAELYDSAYNILTTNIAGVDSGSGVLVNLDGKVIGFIQNQCEVQAQKDTIQAYGISDLKEVIEHLSNNQDIVYMGIVGADVTTAISETENIPIGVYVSEVQLNSPAIRAGIQPGDIITSISGQPVTNQKDMMSVLLKCADGQSIQVVCERPSKTEYQELTFTVELKVLEK